MKTTAIFLVFVASLMTFPVLGSPASAAPTETEIPGVSAELMELRQQGGVTRMAVVLRNDTAQDATGDMLRFSEIVLVDAKSKRKTFAIKDANGKYLGGPISDWNGGGRWAVRVPANGQVTIWAFFEAIDPGSKVSVQLPFMFPFDNVTVTEGPGTLFSSSAADSELQGVRATLVSATRADQQLAVRLKLTRSATGLTDDRATYYEDVYFFDPKSKRKYPLIKDAEGKYQATPMRDGDHGGRFYPADIHAGGTALMSLTFAAPPDDIATGDLVIFGFLPIEHLAIAGQGGAAQGGIAAAGKSVGLEAAYKELKAEVTPKEIRINLSADVLFDFDKSDLKPAAAQELQNLLTIVREKRGTKIGIVGHTDVRGDAAYNQALSERRAGAVKRWLVENGTDAARITASGAGKSRPIRLGNTEADHQANRRVEIRIAN